MGNLVLFFCSNREVIGSDQSSYRLFKNVLNDLKEEANADFLMCSTINIDEPLNIRNINEGTRTFFDWLLEHQDFFISENIPVMKDELLGFFSYVCQMKFYIDEMITVYNINKIYYLNETPAFNYFIEKLKPYIEWGEYLSEVEEEILSSNILSLKRTAIE